MDARFLAFLLVAAILIITPGPDMALVTRNALRDGRAAASRTAFGVALGLAMWGVASSVGLAALLATSAFAFTAIKLAGAVYLMVLGTRTLLGQFQVSRSTFQVVAHGGALSRAVPRRPCGTGTSRADEAEGTPHPKSPSESRSSGAGRTRRQVSHASAALRKRAPVRGGSGTWNLELGTWNYNAFAQGLLNNLLNPKAAIIFLSIFPQFLHPGDPALRLGAMVAAFSLLTLGWLHLYGAAIAKAGERFAPRFRRIFDSVAGAVMIGLGLRLALERR